MSTIEGLREISRRVERLDPFAPPFYTENAYKTGETNIYATPDRQTMYGLEVTLCVTFWASDVTYAKARESAERLMAQRILGRFMDELSEVSHHITCGNREAALRILAEIRSQV